jgi:hypothetical protein
MNDFSINMYGITGKEEIPKKDLNKNDLLS